MLSDNLVGDTHLHTCLVLSAVPSSTKFSVVDLASDDGSFFFCVGVVHLHCASASPVDECAAVLPSTS